MADPIQVMPLAPPGQQPTFGLRPLEIKPLAPLYDPKVAVDALRNVTEAQKETIATSTEALTKNTQIQQDLLNLQMTKQDDSMEAFDNLTRIQRWGDISDILSLFNSKWSESVQANRIKKNDMTVQQQSLRAQAQTNLNNALPALAQAKERLAEIGFENTLKVFEVQSTVKGLEQKDLEIMNKSVEIQLNLSKEQRDRVTLAANALDLKSAQRALTQAAQGKGDWVGLEGILEEKINKEKKAELESENLRTAIQEKRLDLQQKAEQRLASAIPVAEAQALWAQAVSTGNPTINWRGNNIPSATVADALEKNQKTNEALTLSIMNQRAEVVGTLFSEVSNMAVALSSLDPRAGNEANLILRAYQQIDPTNPDPVALTNLRVILESSKKKLGEYAKAAAATFPNPDSKAAIEQFGLTGKPTPQGAQAVVRDSMGRWDLTSGTKYSNSWRVVNKALADRISQQNISGAPLFDPNSEASTQMMLAWFSRTPYKNADRLKEEIMADPIVRAEAAAEMTGTIAADAANKALTVLSEAENGDPVWQTLVNNSQLVTTGGAFDRRKLIDFLEKKTIAGGPNGVDYNKIFYDALRAQVMEVAAGASRDPKSTIMDRHLETLVFGDNPAQAALGDFIANYEDDRARSRELALKAIQSDVSGQTQTKETIEQIGGYGLAKVGITPEAAQRGIKTAPSATGVPLTADEVRTLYGGGVR